MDRLISQLPFFTEEHRDLAQSVAQFVGQEIEPRAAVEEDIEDLARDFVQLLARAGLLSYAVAEKKLDIRALCLIREELAYSSALADLAFVMQGLGTYAIARAAPDHVREFWVSRAANGKAIAAFALTEPGAGSDVAGIQTTVASDSFQMQELLISISSLPKPARAKMVVQVSRHLWLVRRCRGFALSNERR
jgi:acyl-CoA dehydrogenase